MNDKKTGLIATLTTLVAWAVIALIASLSMQHQQYQHQERMACVEQHGVWTSGACAWSAR